MCVWIGLARRRAISGTWLCYEKYYEAQNNRRDGTV